MSGGRGHQRQTDILMVRILQEIRPERIRVIEIMEKERKKKRKGEKKKKERERNKASS